MKGLLDGKQMTMDLTQRVGAREATGTFSIEGFATASRFGVLQVADGWASVGFVNAGHAIVATVDLEDPSERRKAVVVIHVDGQFAFRATMASNAVAIKW